jgi:hypothetical protein
MDESTPIYNEAAAALGYEPGPGPDVSDPWPPLGTYPLPQQHQAVAIKTTTLRTGDPPRKRAAPKRRTTKAASPATGATRRRKPSPRPRAASDDKADA